MTLNYTEILLNILKPLVVYPESIQVTEKVEDNFVSLFCIVKEEDFGRVIGRHGHTINSVRNILYSVAQKDNVRIKLEVQSNETK